MTDAEIRYINELAERIALGQTYEALELLHRLHPRVAPWPMNVLRRVAAGQAEGRAHA